MGTCSLRQSGDSVNHPATSFVLVHSSVFNASLSIFYFMKSSFCREPEAVNCSAVGVILARAVFTRKRPTNFPNVYVPAGPKHDFNHVPLMAYKTVTQLPLALLLAAE